MPESQAVAEEEAALVARVDALRRRFELPDAEKTGLEALARFPGSTAVTIALGRVLLARHRPTDAAALFARIDGPDDRVVAWRIAALSRSQAYDEAIALGSAAGKRFPDSVAVRVALGRVWMDRSHHEAALPLLAEALAVAPHDLRAACWQIRALSALSRWPEARELAAKLVNEHAAQAEAHYVFGKLLLDADEPAEALGHFETALDLDPAHVSALEWQATALRELYRFEDTEITLREALERLPSCTPLHIEYAWLLSHQDRENEAVTAVEKALAIDPRHPWALRSRITFLTYARRLDEAGQAVEEALTHHPDDPDLHTTIAWFHADLDHPDQALESFDRALALDPRHSWALRSRIDLLATAHRFEEAHETADRALAYDPGDPDLHTTIAWLLSNEDREDEAAASAERALALNPRHPWALRSRIIFLRYARRFDEARTAAEEAVTRCPRDPRLLSTIAWLHSQLGDTDKALESCDQALAVDPRHLWALRTRITMLRSAGRFAEARRTAEEALTHHPDNPDLRTTVAWLFSGEDRFEEALANCEAALTADPRHAWTLRSRIDILRFARRFDEAQRAAEEALTQYADDEDLHVTVAWLHSELDHQDEAIAGFDQALAIDPGHLPALRGRISSLRSARRFEEGHRAAEQALALHPDDPDLRVTIAWLLSDQDRDDEALTSCEKALALEPGHSWALRSRVEFLKYLRRFPEAHRAGAEALEHHPDDPDVLTTFAWLLSVEDRDDEAVETVEKALTEYPRHSWALRSRIEFLRYARRFGEGHKAAEEALTHHPHDPDLHTTIAWLLSDQDREDEAAAAAEKALAIHPGHLWALRSRVSFLRYARRFDEAQQAAEQAAALHPGEPAIHTTIAWLHSELDRPDEALASCEKALSINPRDSWALRSRIDLLRDARRFDEAQRAAKEALTHHPDDPDVHVTLAWLHSELDHPDQALASCEKALSINPRHVNATEWRIQTLLRVHRVDDAERAAAAALKRHPTVPKIIIARARVHEHLFDFDAAADCLARALALDPDHTGLNVARSATLRSLRRCGEAEREISRLCRARPHLGDLRAELGWIHHDEHRLAEARQVFDELMKAACCAEERAAVHHGLGWVAFAGGDYVRAENAFRAARREQPQEFDYPLALAWALGRQEGASRWREAETIAGELLKRRTEPSVHICLGVLSFKQGRISSAEYHLKKALEIDSRHGSHADLGALYSQIGRYDEAESELKQAIDQDWYNANAHVELGALLLRIGDDRLPDAEREFRQALAVDATSGAAAIGLAQALTRLGDDTEAESILRRVLQRQDRVQQWRTHLALARLLVERGDKQQNPDLHTEAYAHAQKAIELAPDSEADPHFVAGVAHHRMGSLTADARGRFGYRVRAMHHLRECQKRDSGHAEAQRNLQLLEREMKAVAPAVWGGYAVAIISFSLLATMWVTFFFSDKVTTIMLTATTPVLVGLFTIAVLLPALIRLKLPGFEADLQAGSGPIAPGPTGQVTFGPGRFTVTTGPAGQLPRHE
ncbi:MAG TPA: tetratricopeptide repeat protein [Amycolatopsis sp.]|nr:tetratricopeptide repeat protein [Amycolatopsis sp.]